MFHSATNTYSVDRAPGSGCQCWVLGARLVRQVDIGDTQQRDRTLNSITPKDVRPFYNLRYGIFLRRLNLGTYYPSLSLTAVPPFDSTDERRICAVFMKLSIRLTVTNSPQVHFCSSATYVSRLLSQLCA